MGSRTRDLGFGIWDSKGAPTVAQVVVEAVRPAVEIVQTFRSAVNVVQAFRPAVIVLTLLLHVASVAAQPPPQTAAPPPTTVTDYVVGPQDILTITSYDQA